MNEEDLKEVGVATLGARRKLQIAISGEFMILISNMVTNIVISNFHI